jgi:hypothetical protein
MALSLSGRFMVFLLYKVSTAPQIKTNLCLATPLAPYLYYMKIKRLLWKMMKSGGGAESFYDEAYWVVSGKRKEE